MREARVMMWIDTLFRDLSYGARMLRRQPGTTFLAVLTLSLGIGANTVIYSLLHAALIRPLPFPDADRLVAVVDNFVTQNQSARSPTVPELLDVRAASRTLDPVSFFDTRDAQINGGTEPARAVSARIEADFLRTLGVQPALGRLFNAGDHQRWPRPRRHPERRLLAQQFRRRSRRDRSRHHRQRRAAHRRRRAAGRREFRLLHAGADRVVRAVSDDPDSIRRGPAEFANVRRVEAIARLTDDATIEQADRRAADHLATAPRRSPAALSPRLGWPGPGLLDGRRAAARARGGQRPPNRARAVRGRGPGAADRLREHRAVPAGARGGTSA